LEIAFTSSYSKKSVGRKKKKTRHSRPKRISRYGHFPRWVTLITGKVCRNPCIPLSQKLLVRPSGSLVLRRNFPRMASQVSMMKYPERSVAIFNRCTIIKSQGGQRKKNIKKITHVLNFPIRLLFHFNFIITDGYLRVSLLQLNPPHLLFMIADFLFDPIIKFFLLRFFTLGIPRRPLQFTAFLDHKFQNIPAGHFRDPLQNAIGHKIQSVIQI
jgi:hypothetical protein